MFRSGFATLRSRAFRNRDRAIADAIAARARVLLGKLLRVQPGGVERGERGVDLGARTEVRAAFDNRLEMRERQWNRCELAVERRLLLRGLVELWVPAVERVLFAQQRRALAQQVERLLAGRLAARGPRGELGRAFSERGDRVRSEPLEQGFTMLVGEAM
jgi:hypothetical protein